MASSIFINANPVTLYKDVTATGSTGGGAEADVSSYTMPGGTLWADGQSLEIFVSAKHAANVNSTTFRPYVNGTAYGPLTSTGSGEMCGGWVLVIRTSSSTMSIFGETHSGTGSFNQIHAFQTGVNFTGNIILKYTVQAATTNNDLIGNSMRVVWFP